MVNGMFVQVASGTIQTGHIDQGSQSHWNFILSKSYRLNITFAEISIYQYLHFDGREICHTNNLLMIQSSNKIHKFCGSQPELSVFPTSRETNVTLFIEKEMTYFLHLIFEMISAGKSLSIVPNLTVHSFCLSFSQVTSTEHQVYHVYVFHLKVKKFQKICLSC